MLGLAYYCNTFFETFFISKIRDIISYIPQSLKNCLPHISPPAYKWSNPVTSEDILILPVKMKPSSSSLDVLPSRLLLTVGLSNCLRCHFPLACFQPLLNMLLRSPGLKKKQV